MLNCAAVDCSSPNIVDGIPDNNVTTFQTSVHVVCKEGYAVNPFNIYDTSLQTVCTETGNWSPPLIVCLREELLFT